MTSTTRAACLLGACVSLAASLGGGEILAQQPDAVEITRIDVTAFPDVEFDVSVPASLTDGSVGAQDVTLTENGIPIPFDVAPVPTDALEIVLLIDTSGSMNENAALASAKDAAVSFLAELPTEVPVGVVGFSDSPSLVSPLTTDRVAIAAAVEQLRATGRTAMYDAIVFGDSLFSGGTTDRQFVLLSDGGDTASVATIDDARAVTTNVRTNAIEIVTSESNSEAMADLADAGGGQLTSIADPAGLGVLYQEVARSLVNRVRVSFMSQSSGETQYAVEVTTPFGPLSGTTVVDLPEAAATSTTTEVPSPTTIAEVGDVDSPRPSSVVAGPADDPEANTNTNSSVLPLVVGAAAVGLGLTTLLIILALGDNRRVGRRQLGVQKAKARPGATSSSIGERATALADVVLERSGGRSGLAQALDVANVALRPGEFIVVAVSGAIAFGAALYLLGGPVLGLIGVVLTPLVARAYLRIKGERRRRSFEEQLPDVLQLMTSALRSGYALSQAIDAVASQAAEPAGGEFKRVNFETRVGVDLGDSLQSMADRMQSTAFGWVVGALEINRDVGGELAKVLNGLAATIRERQQLERQVQTLTAEGRMSAYVLTSLPVLLLLAMALLNPDYFSAYRSSPGPQILIGCGILLAIGWLWMRSMIKTEI
jgi:tight adherence protein B